MSQDDDFQIEGFLGQRVQEETAAIRKNNAGWFALADDLNRALQSVAVRAGGVRGTAGDPKVVSTLIFLKAVQSFQGAVLLIERGLTADARTLARACMEAGFCIAAILENPGGFFEVLKKGFDAARRSQAKFVLSERDAFSKVSDEDFERLATVADEIGKVGALPIDRLARQGPLRSQYLLYKQISNDSVHISAKSLTRHLVVNDDGKTWAGFRWGPGNDSELSEALSHACQAIMAVGVGYTQFIGDLDGNAEFGPLSRRCAELLRLPVP